MSNKALLTGTFDNFPLIEIEGYFCEGQKESGPTYSCGGEPGIPDGIDDLVAFVTVKDKDGKDKKIFLEGELFDYFRGEMEDELLENIEDTRGGDPDREHDRR